MTMKLMYITNKSDVAKIAEESGVDWIFVDLEVNGKEERQGHLDTVKSKHNIEDIEVINKELTKAELVVRINPIFKDSEAEIDKVIDAGADIIMLPFFKTLEEVRSFIEFVDKRVKIILLLETPEAVDLIDEILNLKGIDMIHIGLNDLHLGYDMDFMFELLTNGTVEMLGDKIREKNIKFGFGGIARIGEGELPAESILKEHYRLNSSMVILSRSFCDLSKITNFKEIGSTFNDGVKDIRTLEDSFKNKTEEYFQENNLFLNEKINEITSRLKQK